MAVSRQIERLRSRPTLRKAIPSSVSTPLTTSRSAPNPFQPAALGSDGSVGATGARLQDGLPADEFVNPGAERRLQASHDLDQVGHLLDALASIRMLRHCIDALPPKSTRPGFQPAGQDDFLDFPSAGQIVCAKTSLIVVSSGREKSRGKSSRTLFMAAYPQFADY